MSKSNKERDININLLEETLSSILEDRFGKYSKYIIQDRALPDVRDGLKPVQRRIIYAMWMLNLKAEGQHKKSARVVGDVIGKYHPHGDGSVYKAMVRMAQPWKASEILVDMHGNKGSIDGDPPAAMRYTETKLAKITRYLLEDIDKDTVSFVYNFDDTEREPTILPAYFPVFLVNGAKGIASGYATDTPPHNLGEVIDGARHLLFNPNATIKGLMRHIKGPDFPTGATIYGINDIQKAYESGNARLLVRATIEVQGTGRKRKIVITDIPFDANKPVVLKKIEEIIFNKKISGMKSVRDESDRNGISIVIDLESNVDDVNAIIQYLYKATALQGYSNVNMVAIRDGRPKLLNLKEILESSLAHIKDVLLKKSKFELRKCKKRLEIIEGLIKAVSILDEIIKTIRNSENKQDAINNLVKKFKFTIVQATAIVNLRLHRLTSTDILQLKQEQGDLKKEIAHLKKLIKDKDFLKEHIGEKLKEIKKQFATPRKTIIVDELPDMNLNLTDVLKEEKIGVIVTRDGFIKRLTIENFKEHKSETPNVNENDSIVTFEAASSKDTLLLLTNFGNYVLIPLFKTTTARWAGNGEHVNQFSSVKPGERIISSIVIDSFSNYPENELVVYSKYGKIKKVRIMDFEAFRLSKSIRFMNLKEGDEIAGCFLDSKERKSVVAITSTGVGLQFPSAEIPQLGTAASGVNSISLHENEELVFVTNNKDKRLTYFLNKKFSHTLLKNLKLQSRAQRGVRIIPLKKGVSIISVLQLDDYKFFTLHQSTGESIISNASSLATKHMDNKMISYPPEFSGELISIYGDSHFKPDPTIHNLKESTLNINIKKIEEKLKKENIKPLKMNSGSKKEKKLFESETKKKTKIQKSFIDMPSKKDEKQKEVKKSKQPIIPKKGNLKERTPLKVDDFKLKAKVTTPKVIKKKEKPTPILKTKAKKKSEVSKPIIVEKKKANKISPLEKPRKVISSEKTVNNETPNLKPKRVVKTKKAPQEDLDTTLLIEKKKIKKEIKREGKSPQVKKTLQNQNISKKHKIGKKEKEENNDNTLLDLNIKDILNED